MTVTRKRSRRQRLIDLAVWAAGEYAKERLGLPSEWDQGDWLTNTKDDRHCGTACCIAGKVALEDGGIPVVVMAGELVCDPDEVRRLWNDPDLFFDASMVTFPGNSHPVLVDEYAQEVLELDGDEADQLFSGNNGLHDVLDVIRDLLDEDTSEPSK